MRSLKTSQKRKFYVQVYLTYKISLYVKKFYNDEFNIYCRVFHLFIHILNFSIFIFNNLVVGWLCRLASVLCFSVLWSVYEFILIISSYHWILFWFCFFLFSGYKLVWSNSSSWKHLLLLVGVNCEIHAIWSAKLSYLYILVPRCDTFITTFLVGVNCEIHAIWSIR